MTNAESAPHGHHAENCLVCPGGDHIYLTAEKEKPKFSDLRQSRGRVAGREDLAVGADHPERLRSIPSGVAFAVLSVHGGDALGDNIGGVPRTLMRDGLLYLSGRLSDVRLVAVAKPVVVKATYYAAAASPPIRDLSDFRASLAGSADGIALYGTFRSQAEKLAAIYVNQGMDETTAAKKAANDLLNFQYTYQDGYRVPNAQSKAPPQSLDDIRLGAYAARAALGTTVNGIDLSVRPAVNTLGAYTPQQLAAETATAKRTGHWATNGDESGLWYVYNGQIVKKPDGTPLQLTWAQLATLAEHVRAAETAREGTAQLGDAGISPWLLPRPQPPFTGSPFNAAGVPGRTGTQSGATQTAPPPPPLPPLTIPRELTSGDDRRKELEAQLAALDSYTAHLRELDRIRKTAPNAGAAWGLGPTTDSEFARLARNRAAIRAELDRVR